MGVFAASNPSPYGQHERLHTAVAKSKSPQQAPGRHAARTAAGTGLRAFCEQWSDVSARVPTAPKVHTLTGNSPEIVPFGTVSKKNHRYSPVGRRAGRS
jgi:hypothetical protein